MGAGSDTLFWNFTQEGLQPLAFVELDFPQVVKSVVFNFDWTVSGGSRLISNPWRRCEC